MTTRGKKRMRKGVVSNKHHAVALHEDMHGNPITLCGCGKWDCQRLEQLLLKSRTRR